jgi:hypothetical protein
MSPASSTWERTQGPSPHRGTSARDLVGDMHAVVGLGVTRLGNRHPGLSHFAPPLPSIGAMTVVTEPRRTGSRRAQKDGSASFEKRARTGDMRYGQIPAGRGIQGGTEGSERVDCGWQDRISPDCYPGISATAGERDRSTVVEGSNTVPLGPRTATATQLKVTGA